MKIFLSSFTGAFCAIMASAATLYFVKDYQDTAAAKERLREAIHQSERVSRIYGYSSTSAPESTPEEQAAATPAPQFYPKLVKSVTVKTLDGELTLPAGKVVQLADEKSKPGTVVINYEGYMLTIPESSVALP